MTADNLATVIYIGLASLILAGLISGISAFIVAALAWIEDRNRRWDAEDAVVFGPLAMWGPTDAEADREWADTLDAVNLTPAQVRERFEAARLADRMDKIRTDIACNQFRREIEDFGGRSA